MDTLAIIPARGGSKGLPRKNVRPLCGKPLIAWTIEAALLAKTIHRVVVSTDDPEIADVSRRFGAEVVLRPKEISTDVAPSEGALLHALAELGVTTGYLAFLQCTSPLMLPSDIDGTVKLLASADSAFTATRWHHFLWKQGADGALPVGHSKSYRPMRQQREEEYVEVGAVYGVKIEAFIKEKTRFAGRSALYPIPGERSIEIDDEIDFLLAESLMRRRLNGEKAAQLPQPVEALVMDFDGVLTDNRVNVFEGGQESVRCNRGDGWAISRLKDAGIKLLVLTNESNPAVRRRCDKLAVECIVAPRRKLPLFLAWLDQHGVPRDRAVYIGNDVPDVECMLNSGCGVAPADAYPQAKQAAQIVLDAAGGAGCIRELAALILGDHSNFR